MAACSQAPAPPAAKLWTLFDVQALYASGATADTPVAAPSELPGGIPIGRLLDPQGALFQRRGFAETYEVTYATTEVWRGYPQVWTQPMYVPATGWVDGAPQILRDDSGAWHPIFSVGRGSGFYSPFWKTIYFDVPAGTTTATFTSARQVLDAGLALHEGPGRTIPIVPDGVTLSSTAAVPVTAWLDGATVDGLDFGQALFTWTDDDVVVELPLFVMLMRDAAGNLQAPGIPAVAGVGPIGSGVAMPPTVAGQPRYTSYWRIYTVQVPASARVMADASLQQALQDQGLATAGNIDPNAPADYPDAIGRVTVTPDCLADENNVDPHGGGLTSCLYLDGQAAIEHLVDPGAIQATDLTVTCPFTLVKGAALVPVR